MYDRYKEILSNYAVDLDFYWFCPHSLQALRKVSIKHLLAAVRVKRGQILPVKTSLFLFFCRSEMYSYHRNNIATIWHMQGKLTTILMQQFFLSKCSRKNQTRVWLKCYFLYKMHFKNLWFVLLQNKLMLSQIHFNGGSSIAGLGNMRGGGFVFLKHYHRQCICWLDYVASYPSQPCNVCISVFPFDFVLIFLSLFLFVDCFGYLTLYNCIHVYTAGGDMTLVPS